MSLFRFLFSLSLLVSYGPQAFASSTDDTVLNTCETFLDRAAKKVGLSVPPVLSYVNFALLRNYKPQSLHHPETVEVVAYGDVPPDIIARLPNFVGDSVLKSASEAEELRARAVADLLSKSIHDWRRHQIWYFEVFEELQLIKERDTFLTTFEPNTFVIMRGGYAIGRAKVGEIDTIEWL